MTGAIWVLLMTGGVAALLAAVSRRRFEEWAAPAVFLLTGAIYVFALAGAPELGCRAAQAMGLLSLLAAAVLGFRRYAMGVQLTIPTEDIAAVTLGEDNALRITMQDGKCWTAFTACYRTLRTDGQDKEIVLFTMYVDLWSSLFQDGWSDGQQAMLFDNLQQEAQEVCYVRWDEWDQVTAATKTEGEGSGAQDVIDGDAVSGLLHPLWER